MRTSPAVVTVGHAIVDVLTSVADGVVEGFGLDKGAMTLVGDDRAREMYATFTSTTEVSGGSAANTAIGVASLGTPAGFVGKIADDELGRVFAADIAAAGVAFAVPAAPPGPGVPGTGRCMVMVTPDAERTMCTYLGIGDLVGASDVDEAAIAGAEVVYLEGYLCGLPTTDATVQRVLAAAEGAGTAVSLSLSDPFWVALHGDALDALLDRVDLLFANEEEAVAMVGAGGVDDAVAALARRCATVVVTLGAKGCLVAHGGTVTPVAATIPGRVVDTTGAGDLFAAGYLHGLVTGADPIRSAQIGGIAAAEVIGHMGARPTTSLSGLLDRA